MMKEIMNRAWEIAREGAANFGGKASEYISEAMKIAWSETKEQNEDWLNSQYIVEVENRRDRWVAKIVGTHPTYRMDRYFLRERYVEDYNKVFLLDNGLYEIKDSNNRGRFILVVNKTVQFVEYADAVEIAKAIEGVAA